MLKLISLLLLLISTNVYSLPQTPFTLTCTKSNGAVVQTMTGAGFGDIAQSTFINGMPVIMIDPYHVSKLNISVQAWMYSHECGHHYLGHIEKGYSWATTAQKQAMELEADCYAIQVLRRLGILNNHDVNMILGVVSRLKQNDLAHPSGIVRASQVSSCLNKTNGAS
ncbi:MAG: hypothetical protein OQK73_03735 [Gammaproteobacteria bacterium]|nr:hypothetical protein [Gammaproteobacteria bacterium]